MSSLSKNPHSKFKTVKQRKLKSGTNRPECTALCFPSCCVKVRRFLQWAVGRFLVVINSTKTLEVFPPPQQPHSLNRAVSSLSIVWRQRRALVPSSAVILLSSFRGFLRVCSAAKGEFLLMPFYENIRIHFSNKEVLQNRRSSWKQD